MHTLEHAGRKLIVLAGRSESSEGSLLSSAAAISGAGGSVRLLNAELVFGMDHIRSAFQKAARAFDNGRNVSDSLATETMLYMSGCRQIQEAMELFDLKRGRGAVVCLADPIQGIEGRLAGDLSIREGDEVLADIHKKDLRGFGVGQAEAETVPRDKQADLVLERVAGVDIKKK